ncbi:MAG: hypothetical protein COA83_05565 [Methylophaga sp.]|nr:MAG: hypothetical protein COA83_05565 [Methylophaga sp.]
MSISQSNKEALKNPWVLGIATVLLIAMSGTFFLIYIAFKNPPSLVDKNFYESGKNYEAIRDQLEQQQILGWTGTFILPTNTRVNQTKIYEVLLQDKNSIAIALDSVVMKAYRPSDINADFSAIMLNTTPGIYAAEMSFNLPGTWDLVVEAKQGDNEYLMTKRISIRP